MCDSNRQFTNPPTGQGRDITSHTRPPDYHSMLLTPPSGYHSGATPRWGYHFFIGLTGIALCLCTTTGNITIFTFPTQGIWLVTLAPTHGLSPKVYVRPTEYHCNFPKESDIPVGGLVNHRFEPHIIKMWLLFHSRISPASDFLTHFFLDIFCNFIFTPFTDFVFYFVIYLFMALCKYQVLVMDLLMCDSKTVVIYLLFDDE